MHDIEQKANAVFDLPVELKALSSYLALRHHLTLDEVEPTPTQGYWRIRKACGGRAGGCNHPMHSTLFNETGCHHTVSYLDSRRNGARFASPYRTWRFHREWVARHEKAAR